MSEDDFVKLDDVREFSEDVRTDLIMWVNSRNECSMPCVERPKTNMVTVM